MRVKISVDYALTNRQRGCISRLHATQHTMESPEEDSHTCAGGLRSWGKWQCLEVRSLWNRGTEAQLNSSFSLRTPNTSNSWESLRQRGVHLETVGTAKGVLSDRLQKR